MANVKEFIREYTKAIQEGYAAVFAGAGLSRVSGYINWKELVNVMATDIGLDAEKEHDLIALTQYYCNERGGRGRVNQIILNEFTKDTKENENIEILSRLPIQTYWTTNYDELIETSIKAANRKVDIKSTQESLAQNIYDRDAIVYKMHGDVRDAAKTVIVKDDYDKYPNERPLFRTALTADLISKTFLFVGFSFDDPNLNFVLSQIKVLLGESQREHYCFFEKTNREKFDSEEEFLYVSTKQKLVIKDLSRYGIQVVLLKTYSEITSILFEVEQAFKLNNIFISGSVTKVYDPWTKETVDELAYKLSKKLVENDCKVISGFGLRIGSSVINGALEEIFNSKYKHVDEYLCLRPFPQNVIGTRCKGELWKEYRYEMINQAGICIFIFGNKDSKNGIVEASGMIEEYQIAKKLGKIIIPIGSTGGASNTIYENVKENILEYLYLEKHIDALGIEIDVENLVKLIVKIVVEQQRK